MPQLKGAERRHRRQTLGAILFAVSSGGRSGIHTKSLLHTPFGECTVTLLVLADLPGLGDGVVSLHVSAPRHGIRTRATGRIRAILLQFIEGRTCWNVMAGMHDMSCHNVSTVTIDQGHCSMPTRLGKATQRDHQTTHTPCSITQALVWWTGGHVAVHRINWLFSCTLVLLLM